MMMIEWKLIEKAVLHFMIKQVRGLLNLFVTKMTNVDFLQIIKLNREAMVKYAYLSFSHLLIVFFAMGADILNTTYHVKFLWRIYTLQFSNKV